MHVFVSKWQHLLTVASVKTVDQWNMRHELWGWGSQLCGDAVRMRLCIVAFHKVTRYQAVSRTLDDCCTLGIRASSNWRSGDLRGNPHFFNLSMISNTLIHHHFNSNVRMCWRCSWCSYIMWTPLMDNDSKIRSTDQSQSILSWTVSCSPACTER